MEFIALNGILINRSAISEVKLDTYWERGNGSPETDICHFHVEITMMSGNEHTLHFTSKEDANLWISRNIHQRDCM